MDHESVARLRSLAKAAGVSWQAVVDRYEMLREQDREKRARPNEVRQAAWWYATANSPGCAPFWRHGFVARYGRRVEQSDHTAIPGYDEIAQEVGSRFGEFAGDDGTERLWSFLLSPYEKRPSREDLLKRALRELEDEQSRGECRPAARCEWEF
jgi:hypothetical protein